MKRLVSILTLVTAVALATGVAAQWPPQAPVSTAPTAEQIQALVERLRVNQHRNDAALMEYERHERRFEWKNKEGEERTVTDDKTYRVVPTGTGTLKLVLEEKGARVSDALYAKQLRDLESALNDALHPEQPRQRQAVEKWEKKSRERRELVDAVPNAFTFTWLGREAKDGRTYAKLQLDPNPDFKPQSKNQETLKHVRATIWVDEAAGQLARVEAEIAKDIGVFGGVFGKVYKGGTFLMEQVKVAEGIWLPTRFEYDFDGRRLFFPFSVNEATEISRFRRIGPPAEALAAVRREIKNGAAVPKGAPAGTNSNGQP